MDLEQAQQLHSRYTFLSDRFRSSWTFYQFLGGVYKHQQLGKVPFDYDFQRLYKRLQALSDQLGGIDGGGVNRDLDRIEDELKNIERGLAGIDREFPPSAFRPFFDKLKRQDDNILYALVKFYLNKGGDDDDSLDKLGILLTRVGEIATEDGVIVAKDRVDLNRIFTSLDRYSDRPELVGTELRGLVQATRQLREQIEKANSFSELLENGGLDRFRSFKRSLGRRMLVPELLIEVVVTNIAAAQRFGALYQDEEVKILEDTNRIFQIERYVQKNPDFAHADLREQIEAFRVARNRYDEGRKAGNIKRDQVAELRTSMVAILDRFDPKTGIVRPETMNDAPGKEAELEAETTSEVEAETESEAGNGVGHEAIDDLWADDDGPDDDGGLVEITDVLELDEIEGEDAVSSEADEAPSAPEPAVEAPRPSKVVVRPMPSPPTAPQRVVARAQPQRNQLDPTTTGIRRRIEALLDGLGGSTAQQIVTSAEAHEFRLEEVEAQFYRQLVDGEVSTSSFRGLGVGILLDACALRWSMEECRSAVRLHGRTGDDAEMAGDLERAAELLPQAEGLRDRLQWLVEAPDSFAIDDLRHGLDRCLYRFMAAWTWLWLERDEYST